MANIPAYLQRTWTQ